MPRPFGIGVHVRQRSCARYVHHRHLWEVLNRLHLANDADPSKLEQWRRAPEGSQEEIWAEHYDRP